MRFFDPKNGVKKAYFCKKRAIFSKKMVKIWQLFRMLSIINHARGNRPQKGSKISKKSLKI